MAFKARNCPKCGNIYIEIGHKVCPDCYREIQNIQLEVCAYIRDNPDASVEEIMEATGADMPIIRRMSREGFFEGKMLSYPCKKCGAPIFTGSLCNKCLGKIQKNLKVSMNAIDARKKLIALSETKGTYRTIKKQD